MFTTRRLELFALLLAAGFVWSWWFGSTLARFGFGAALAALGALLAARGGRALFRRLIWRLRDRLLVAYLFIAVIPVSLVVLLTLQTARFLGGQLAVHLVSSEMDRRASALLGAARTIARAPAGQRDIILQRVQGSFRHRFPNLQIEVEEPLPAREAEISGVVSKDHYLFLWARAQFEERRVSLLTPITRKWLSGLSPGLGGVSILPGPDSALGTLHLNESGDRDDDSPSAVPKAANALDMELLWFSEIPVAIWGGGDSTEVATLGVHSRLSAVLRIVLAQKIESKLPVVFYFIAGIFFFVEVISIYIGASLTRTITQAINNLYEGTQRVMQGDFSHRIAATGNDQIAELSHSFNRMTENVERLLRVAGENQRIQAELEIARQVQNQLFPNVVPNLKGLQLNAACHPARTVSGDYYDYQMLPDGRLALALGDIAGKSISAALLMASLQASLRMQLRQEGLAPAKLVARLNRHMHANTTPEKYATFFFALFDDATGQLTYTNAGHLPPLLFRGGSVLHLEVNGMVVGAFPFAEYTESQITLLPGDLLVGYTDGITEPENEYGEMFGEQRLIDVVTKNASHDGGAIIQSVIEAVQQFTGSPELQDDMTLVIARRV